MGNFWICSRLSYLFYGLPFSYAHKLCVQQPDLCAHDFFFVIIIFFKLTEILISVYYREWRKHIRFYLCWECILCPHLCRGSSRFSDNLCWWKGTLAVESLWSGLLYFWDNYTLNTTPPQNTHTVDFTCLWLKSLD